MPHKLSPYILKNLILLISTVLFTVTSVFHPQSILAENLPFIESFDGGFDKSWTLHLQDASLSFVGDVLTFKAYPNPKIFSFIEAGDFSWQDYSYQVDVFGENSVDKIILFRVTSSRASYAINVRSAYTGDGNDILLQKTPDINSGVVWLLDHVNFENFQNRWYKIRVDVANSPSGVTIEVYVDDLLKIDYLDSSNFIPEGAIGLGVWPEGEETTKYDNLTVSDLNSPDMALVVPNFYQFSPPWNSNIYNYASSWSQNPIVENWGCALTSAVMILRYYNHNVTPGTPSNDYPSAIDLNSWLKSQPDGYLKNGLLNWLAVSRFTNINNVKVKETKDLPTLEYLRYDHDDTRLDTGLSEEDPPIVKVPGHFVVVKGKQDSEYLVNDPGSETRILLSQVEEAYGGEYLAINQYNPSETDLSYIMLVIDGGVNINVSGPSEGYTFIEDPLVDDENLQVTSGNILKIHLIPKPEDGEYSIEISGGNSPFHLQAYRYDTEGNLIGNRILNFKGNTEKEDPYTFTMFYGEGTQIKTLIQILKSFWEGGEIKDGVYFGLRDKLIASDYLRIFSLKTSNNILKAFVKQLNAQRGKGISENAYAELYEEANAILTQSQ